MAIHRLHHSFTSGEITPLLHARIDIEKFNSSCRVMKNAFPLIQGPCRNRPGTRFIYDLSKLNPASGTPVRLIPFVFNELQAYVMLFFVHEGGGTRMVLGTGSGLVLNDDSTIFHLDMPAGWNVANFDYAQSADELYVAQSTLPPHIIKRASHNVWTVERLSVLYQPDEWTWSNGWPECTVFHQQRLVFAANKSHRQMVWMSQAGDFPNFGVSDPIVPSDAITFTLASSEQNKIQWLASGKALFVGTLGGEWTVSGGSQTAVTPENIMAQKQTNTGSLRIKPVGINFVNLFVGPHGRGVYELAYVLNYDTFTTNGLLDYACHLTDAHSIIDWAYQQVPYRLLWCIRDDGDLIGMTYNREQKVVGWHHHNTNGKFISTASIPGDNREDEVWFVIQRHIDGQDLLYLEKMLDFREVFEAKKGRFLDSYVDYEGPPIQHLSGLEHLENETVSILADGMVLPPRRVVGGQLDLLQYYGEIVVGMPYVSDIWPNTREISLQSGASLGRNQRMTYINLDLYNSGGLYIGRYDSEDGESEEEIAFRNVWDYTNQQIPLFSGFYRWAFAEGFDRDPIYFIRQKDPLPLILRGVVDEIEVFE